MRKVTEEISGCWGKIGEDEAFQILTQIQRTVCVCVYLVLVQVCALPVLWVQYERAL